MTATETTLSLSAAILQRVSQSANLPSPPHVISELLHLLGDERTQVSELAEVCSRDPALAARILSAANSALYRMGTPATSLKQAVSRLGMRGVRGIALGLASKNLGGQLWPELRGRCWRHCLAVGAAARLLARHARATASGDFFVFGLMYNIGELVSLQVAERIDEAMELGESEISEAIAYSNAPAGQSLFLAWALPEVIGELHGLSHRMREPENAGEARVAHVIQLADAAARSFDLGPVEDEGIVIDDHPSIEALGLTHYQVCDLEVELIDLVVELSDAFSS